MRQSHWITLSGLLFLVLAAPSAFTGDVSGVVEHPMVERYPGQVITWQHIENYQPYRIARGPVTGYREISDWIDIEGRVTRTFYKYQGLDRTYSEIYKNFLDALQRDQFEILGSGFADDRKGRAIGSRQWMDVALRENPVIKPGEVGTLLSGTASEGGAGAILATKERASGTVYLAIFVEQHADNFVGTLIDIVEINAAETGLVVVNHEAMGSDMDEYGRVVLNGIVFEFDKSTLKPESNAALGEIAEYLRSHKDESFYVVGHTDSKGSFAYNQKLSFDRSRAVIRALTERFGIAADRLQPHGVGPLVPVFSNTSDAGRQQNRRVELVRQ
ncbi:MAG: OmpA family protein [Congregibacter sp.]